MKDVKIGNWYRHKRDYKLVQIFGVAKHFETDEWFAMYVHISNEFNCNSHK